jgi:ankyrin repeat protein
MPNKKSKMNPLTDSRGNTPLHMACRKKDTQAARQLIASGCDVNAQNNDGDTALHLAADAGMTEVVHLLLSHRANPRVKNKYLVTPLHLARNESISVAIRYDGADPNALDINDKLPIHWAAKRGLTQTVEELIRAGSAVNKMDKQGNTPLHLSINQEVTEVLIKHGASLFTKNTNGAVPVDMAMKNRRHRIVKSIAKAYANLPAAKPSSFGMGAMA